jgi:MFS transporter, DHA1 family, tetracycline resistance protein
VSPSEQGQLQGALSSIRGISGMLGPGLFTLTFASFIGPFRSWNLPGSPFLLSCMLLIASLITISTLKRDTN